MSVEGVFNKIVKFIGCLGSGGGYGLGGVGAKVYVGVGWVESGGRLGGHPLEIETRHWGLGTDYAEIKSVFFVKSGCEVFLGGGRHI